MGHEDGARGWGFVLSDRDDNQQRNHHTHTTKMTGSSDASADCNRNQNQNENRKMQNVKRRKLLVGNADNNNDIAGDGWQNGNRR